MEQNNYISSGMLIGVLEHEYAKIWNEYAKKHNLNDYVHKKYSHRFVLVIHSTKNKIVVLPMGSQGLFQMSEKIKNLTREILTTNTEMSDRNSFWNPQKSPLLKELTDLRVKYEKTLQKAHEKSIAIKRFIKSSEINSFFNLYEETHIYGDPLVIEVTAKTKKDFFMYTDKKLITEQIVKLTSSFNNKVRSRIFNTINSL